MCEANYLHFGAHRGIIPLLFMFGKATHEKARNKEVLAKGAEGNLDHHYIVEEA